MKFNLQKNVLHYYMDLLRSKAVTDAGNALNNILVTMRRNRHDRICGECFDELDFGNILLNDIFFSDDGEIPSSFNFCSINEWNIHGGLIGRP